MTSLENVIKDLNNKVYVSLCDEFVKTNAEKYLILLKLLREGGLREDQIMSQLNVSQSAFYALKARLHQRIKDFLITTISLQKPKYPNSEITIPYFSYVVAGQVQESKHQLKFNSFINTASGQIPQQPDEAELVAKFIAKLYETDINEIEDYLDFHYKKYKGRKINWWRYAKSRIEDLRTDYDRNQKRIHPSDEFILEWFEKNKEDKESNLFTRPKEKLGSKISFLSWLIQQVTLYQKNPVEIKPSLIKDYISHDSIRSYLNELKEIGVIDFDIYQGFGNDEYEYSVNVFNTAINWVNSQNEITNQNAINSSKKKYKLPVITISEDEKYWLENIYERFLNNEEFEYRYLLPKLWDKLPEDFEPTNMSNLLVRGGKDITLLGIWQIDPASTIFEKFDKVIYIVREILQKDNAVKKITSKQIHELNPELSSKDILHVVKLMWHFGSFMNGMGKGENLSSNFSIDDDNVYRQYRIYPGLNEFVNDYLKRNVKKDNKQVDEDVYPRKLVNTADSLNLNEKAFQNKAELHLRDKKEIDIVLGAQELAQELSEVIKRMPTEQGMMIGIFGKWGRGKTILMTQLWENLKTIMLNKKEQFEKVDFHAWHYQETPASWAYLYERLAEKYYKKPKKFSVKEYYLYGIRRVKLNMKREGWTPIFKFLISLVFATSIILGGIYEWGKTFAAIGIPVIGTTLIAIFSKLNKEYSTKAFDLIKKYGLKHSYKDTMGVQAEIQKEIVHLVQTWIPIEKNESQNSDKEHNKIILFVEDIDRCAEEKIIQNIDALRIMLEDEEVAKRIIVITAIDEQVLKRAVKAKYFELLDCEEYSENREIKFFELSKLANEYLDKLFIAGIKLGTLSAQQRDEFIIELSKHDRKDSLIEEKKAEDSEISDELIEGWDLAVQDGDFVIVDGDFALQNEKGEIKSRKQLTHEAATKPSKSDNKIKFEKLTKEEIRILRDCVHGWDDSTPRKIRIFYYRYLIAKNLLLNRYQRLNRENVWQHPNYSSVFAQLIISYSELHNPRVITEHKLKATAIPENEVVRIDMFADVTIKNGDHLELLKVLEMVIAY